MAPRGWFQADPRYSLYVFLFIARDIFLIHRLSPLILADLRVGGMGVGYHVPE